MTLITWALTHEYAVIVSDRRLTTFVGGVPQRWEDRAMKTFLLNGQMLMGYTGLAYIGPEPMETWVAETLSGVAPNDIPRALCDGMQAHYDANQHLAGMPHHFRLLGFAFDPKRTPSRFPIGYEVGNCDWREAGGRVSPFGVREFRWTMNGFGNHKVLVGAVGASYKHRSLRDLDKLVKQAHRSNPSDPSRTFAPILAFHAEVAAGSGRTVGETVVVTSIPRHSVPIREYTWNAPLALEGIRSSASAGPFAMTLSGDQSTTDMFFPASIWPDLQVVGGLMSQTPPDESPGDLDDADYAGARLAALDPIDVEA